MVQIDYISMVKTEENVLRVVKPVLFNLVVRGVKIMKINLRKYYLYKYCQLVLNSNDEKQKQFRLKHFTKTINLMWTPMASNEINVIKSFIRNLKNAFTFLEYQEVWDNISKTTNQN